MAEGNWSVIRVEKISAEGAQKTERHNERKNESYANLNVDTEQIARNVHFKDTGGLTYNEYFQRLIDEGKISTRGQKAGATVFNELVIDVNTRYFEEHGGYEYARQFYEEAYRFGCEIYGEENIVSAVMHADEILAAFGGNKFFCNHLCGRGQLYCKLGGDLKCSRNKPTPKWMASKWFRYGFLIFFTNFHA